MIIHWRYVGQRQGPPATNTVASGQQSKFMVNKEDDFVGHGHSFPGEGQPRRSAKGKSANTLHYPKEKLQWGKNSTLLISQSKWALESLN